MKVYVPRIGWPSAPAACHVDEYTPGPIGRAGESPSCRQHRVTEQKRNTARSCGSRHTMSSRTSHDAHEQGWFGAKATRQLTDCFTTHEHGGHHSFTRRKVRRSPLARKLLFFNVPSQSAIRSRGDHPPAGRANSSGCDAPPTGHSSRCLAGSGSPCHVRRCQSTGHSCRP